MATRYRFSNINGWVCAQFYFDIFPFQLDARNFITEDTLEEEIEKALNSRVNYNYAIDLSGNKYIELADTTLEKMPKEKEAATS